MQTLPRTLGPMTSPRTRRMAERIARVVADVGVPAEGVAEVGGAFARAMTPRESGPSALPSDRHHDFLHPGRTVLILASDLGEAEVSVLALGALVESRHEELGVGAAAVAELLEDRHPEALEWWHTLPRPEWDPVAAEASPADDELLEGLVTAPEPVQRVALSEALDHLRHAHLWESAAERARAVEIARTALAPAAARTHPVLDRRYAWWLRRVGPAIA